MTTLAPLPRIDTLHLFPGERAALLDVLADLSPAEWDLPTACAGWSMKDVAAHLLGDDIGRLSWGRDGYVNPAFAAALPGLVTAIDRQNAVWAAGARRMSPRVIVDLLALTGEWTQAYFASLDLDAPGMPVDWAGPEPAPAAPGPRRGRPSKRRRSRPSSIFGRSHSSRRTTAGPLTRSSRITISFAYLLASRGSGLPR